MNIAYINYLKGDQKSPRTIAEYTKYINQMLEFVGKDEGDITYTDLVNWKANISHLSPNTICLQIAAIKSYFGFLEEAEIITSNPATKIKRPAKKAKEKPYPEASMIRAIVDNARTDRDRAIIMLFATTGLRFSELANITLDEYKHMGGAEGREIKILGKGSKERTVYVNDETKLAIDMYLTTRPKSDCDKLFLSNWGNELQENNFNLTLKNTFKRAGVPFWKEVSPHWLRAAAATMYAEAGVPIEDIRDLLGHSSASTTSIYLKSCKSRIRNMVMDVRAF